ncbi:MAG: hypothetical protein L6Q37_07070 [Bdellovibrionaceae bacterium]|nr:hypothetical protein [Pseudobdellovibrionaceae bacterium]NUM57157.1 hypothetical protein [Pseudobdellovibrionaceae bacterium]
MKLNYFLVIFFIISSLCSAQELKVTLFPFNFDYRYVEISNGEYQFNQFKNLSFSTNYERHQLLLEHVEYQNSSGNQTINFDETTQEYHVSYLYEAHRLNSYFSLYLGLGSGFYNAKLVTRYLDQEITDKTNNTLFLSGLISLQFHFKFFTGQIDFRLLEAKDYRPQPTPEMILRTGFSF